ncbi:MAG: dolichol-phosphate mannosyltransferase [Oligoflexia bacterium]|nr:MAG: dolichol-phosphate mannosyltransferase [Oligoflexia bacterium]
MKTLVVIPTYNERENIEPMIQALLQLPIGIEILVVDDSSPDGTGKIVESIHQKEPRVHLLTRTKKEGLGRAYIAGFQWGIGQGFEAIVEMDADFSHRPQDLVPLLDCLKTHDFAVGSRYVPGGRTVNWGLGRKIISRGGSLYSRIILGFPLNDWTGGFNAWKKHVLEKINLSTVRSNGYSFQIELKYKALRAGCQGKESPIVFEDRRVGQSKMSLKIVLEAFYKVWMMRFQN